MLPTPLRSRAPLIAALAALALAALVQPARAIFVFTLQENGSGVTITGAGSLVGVFRPPTGGADPGVRIIQPSASALYSGAYGVNSAGYNNFLSGPSTFGGDLSYAGRFTHAMTASGDVVGLSGASGKLILPFDYVSGAPLANLLTFPNETFASLQFVPGTYTYALPSGDTLVITGVPEPSTWALLAAGAGLLRVFISHRRPRAHV